MPPILPDPARVTPGYAPGYAGRTDNPLMQKAKRARRNRVTDVTDFRIPYRGISVTPPGCHPCRCVLFQGGYTVTHPLIYVSKPLIYIYRESVTVAVTARNPGYAGIVPGCVAQRRVLSPSSRAPLARRSPSARPVRRGRGAAGGAP